MKLSSVVLLSVNLVACSQVSAQAADTASFLQDALALPEQAQASQPLPNNNKLKKSSKIQNQKKTLSGHQGQLANSSTKHASKHSRAYIAMTPVIDGVKVRPFVPGRFLPSEAELESQRFAEQQARQAKQEQMAFQNFNSVFEAEADANAALSSNATLRGQVSNFSKIEQAKPYISSAYNSYKSNNGDDYLQKMAQAALRKAKQAASKFSMPTPSVRAVPGMNPVMPGQICPSPRANSNNIAEVPEPQQESKELQMQEFLDKQEAQIPEPPKVYAYDSRYKTNSYQLENNQSVSNCVKAPVLSKFEEAQLDKVVTANLPANMYAARSINGESRLQVQGNPGFAGGGPPSFPLSAIPKAQASRSFPATSSPLVGQQARFGSWHNGMNLPKSTFHSYLPVYLHGPMKVKIRQAHTYTKSHKTLRGANHSSSQYLARNSNRQNSEYEIYKQVNNKSNKAVKAATYAPYWRYPSYM